jgi:hypothetical protein
VRLEIHSVEFLALPSSTDRAIYKRTRSEI